MPVTFTPGQPSSMSRCCTQVTDCPREVEVSVASATQRARVVGVLPPTAASDEASTGAAPSDPAGTKIAAFPAMPSETRVSSPATPLTTSGGWVAWYQRTASSVSGLYNPL